MSRHGFGRILILFGATVATLLGRPVIGYGQWNPRKNVSCLIRPDRGSQMSGVGLPALGWGFQPRPVVRIDNPFGGVGSVWRGTGFSHRPRFAPRPVVFAPTFNYCDRPSFYYPSSNLTQYSSTSLQTSGANVNVLSYASRNLMITSTPTSAFGRGDAPQLYGFRGVTNTTAPIQDRTISSALMEIKSRKHSQARTPIDAAQPSTAVSQAPSREDESLTQPSLQPLSTQQRETTEAALDQGDQLFKRGDYRQAREEYTRALVIAGEEPGVRIPFGLTEFALGRFSDASRAMRAAASRRPVLDPDSIDLRQAYGKAGEFEAQVRALESFVGRNPFDADALFLLGFIKACTGNAVGAKAVFEKYLALPGADPAVRSFVKKVGAAA